MPANHVSVSVNRRLALAGSCAPPVPVQGAALRPLFACNCKVMPSPLPDSACIRHWEHPHFKKSNMLRLDCEAQASWPSQSLPRVPPALHLCMRVCMVPLYFSNHPSLCSATQTLYAGFYEICEMQHEENCNSFQRRTALCAVAGFRSSSRSSSSLSSSTTSTTSTTITCNLFVSQFTLALAEASVASFLLQLPFVAFYDGDGGDADDDDMMIW